MRRIFLTVPLVLVVATVLAVVGSAWLIRAAARGRTYDSLRLIPHRHVGLVLGCGAWLGDGTPNPFFVHRVAAAAGLYRAGRVDVLLASGESHANYDESAELKADLIRAGVPADRIYCDPAGYRTLDSVVRARVAFGQTAITVISQQDHDERAIFLAAHHGVDAIGFDAAPVGYPDNLGNRVRELFARVEAVLDVYCLHTGPRETGPRVDISVPGPKDRGPS